jgi:hypothetical protein
MIEDKNVFEMTNEQFAYIITLLDRRYEDENFGFYSFKQIIFDQIEEVKDIYNTAIKKSIIDYILLDHREKDRLGVHSRFNAPIFYGERGFEYEYYNPQSLYKKSKDGIEEKLLKNSQNTLQIQALWTQKYEQRELIIVPGTLDPYIVVDEFWDRQKVSLKKFKE